MYIHIYIHVYIYIYIHTRTHMFSSFFDPEGLPYKYLVFAPEVDR